MEQGLTSNAENDCQSLLLKTARAALLLDPNSDDPEQEKIFEARDFLLKFLKTAAESGAWADQPQIFQYQANKLMNHVVDPVWPSSEAISTIMGLASRTYNTRLSPQTERLDKVWHTVIDIKKQVMEYLHGNGIEGEWPCNSDHSTNATSLKPDLDFSRNRLIHELCMCSDWIDLMDKKGIAMLNLQKASTKVVSLAIKEDGDSIMIQDNPQGSHDNSTAVPGRLQTKLYRHLLLIAAREAIQEDPYAKDPKQLATLLKHNTHIGKLAEASDNGEWDKNPELYEEAIDSYVKDHLPVVACRNLVEPLIRQCFRSSLDSSNQSGSTLRAFLAMVELTQNTATRLEKNPLSNRKSPTTVVDHWLTIPQRYRKDIPADTLNYALYGTLLEYRSLLTELTRLELSQPSKHLTGVPINTVSG